MHPPPLQASWMVLSRGLVALRIAIAHPSSVAQKPGYIYIYIYNIYIYIICIYIYIFQRERERDRERERERENQKYMCIICLHSMCATLMSSCLIRH